MDSERIIDEVNPCENSDPEANKIPDSEPIEDILCPDSESDSTEFDEDEHNDYEDDPVPNFDFRWNEETSTTKFRVPSAIFADSESRFNDHSPPIAMSSPFEVLKSYITTKIINDIVEETNRYASEIKLKKPKALLNWKNIIVSDIWSFLGLHLLTGIVKKPSYKDYWSTDSLLETPIFPNTMSKNRFEEILRSFHLVDNGDNYSRSNGRLWKLGNLLPDLMTNFEYSINPGEYLCVDESLLQFKGRLSFKQYMPLKRSRFGIKYFALVDCETKFLIKLKIYLGKSSNLDQASHKEFGLGGSTVISLLNGYYLKNHKVVLNNWFNSPKLVEYLMTMSTYALGTVKKSRKGLPIVSTKLSKGGVESYTTGSLLLERWQDRREVIMLNSFVEHEMKDSPSTNPRNHRQKPKSVLLYNKKMGGVDHIDQQLAPYESLRKSIKWYKKLAFHLIDLAVYNSFIIFKNHIPSKKMNYKEFLMDLIREILSTHRIQRNPRGRPMKNIISIPQVPHWPQKMFKENKKPKNSDCSNCKNEGKRKATPFRCEICKKYLCISGPDSCFKKFHSRIHSCSHLENATSQNVTPLHHHTNDLKFQSSEQDCSENLLSSSIPLFL